MLGSRARRPAVASAASAVASVTRRLGLRSLSEHVRSKAIGSQPIGPTDAEGMLPEIEMLVPVGPADVEIAAWAIATSLPGVANPIAAVHLVVPTREIGDAVAGGVDRPVHVWLDDDVLGPEEQDAIERFPADRRGWLRQQAVKVALAARNEAAGVLVLDADTALTRRRVFLDERHVGLLMPTYELHLPYFEHLGRVFGDEFRSPIRGWSHVAHHLLMQPELVRAMLEEIRARHGKPAIAAMIELADPSESSSCAIDYEAYAEWCLRRAPKRVREVLRGNHVVPRREGSPAWPRDAFSVSRHYYRTGAEEPTL